MREGWHAQIHMKKWHWFRVRGDQFVSLCGKHRMPALGDCKEDAVGIEDVLCRKCAIRALQHCLTDCDDTNYSIGKSLVKFIRGDANA